MLSHQIFVNKFDDITIFLDRKYEEGRKDCDELIEGLTALGFECYRHEPKIDMKGEWFAPSGTYCVKLGRKK